MMERESDTVKPQAKKAPIKKVTAPPKPVPKVVAKPVAKPPVIKPPVVKMTPTLTAAEYDAKGV
jgi:hypothetical protein